MTQGDPHIGQAICLHTNCPPNVSEFRGLDIFTEHLRGCNVTVIIWSFFRFYYTRQKRNAPVRFSPANCPDILISDQILLKLECGVDEYLCLPGIGIKHIKANGKGVYSMMLSTWNFEYALQLQITKTVCFR